MSKGLEGEGNEKRGLTRRQMLAGLGTGAATLATGEYMRQSLNQNRVTTERKRLEQPTQGSVIPAAIESPYAEAVADSFVRHFGEKLAPRRLGMLNNITHAFLNETLRNVGAADFSNSENQELRGVSFPVGFIDTGQIAKQLYEHSTGKKIGELRKVRSGPARREFVFVSMEDLRHGNPFSYQEEALHQLTLRLPAALEAIARGEEPESNEVYTLGSPTNVLGSMTDDFLKGMKEKGSYDQFGLMYSEFIGSILKNDAVPPPKLYLWGISMGAALASKTGKQLLDDKMVTQVKEENSLPQMQVRLETAPGSSDVPDALKRVAITVGFGIDGTLAIAGRDPYIQAVWSGEAEFLQRANKEFAKQGVHEHMSPEQQALKGVAFSLPNVIKKTVQQDFNDGLSLLVTDLLRGVPIPEGLKVTEVVGMFDPTMPSVAFTGDALIRRLTKENSLGRDRGYGSTENRRRRSAAEMHVPPFQRANEIRRQDRAAYYLELVQDGKLLGHLAETREKSRLRDRAAKETPDS